MDIELLKSFRSPMTQRFYHALIVIECFVPERFTFHKHVSNRIS
jgi:hypothetical protein